MKKFTIFITSLILILILPLLVGCSDKKIPTIQMSAYFKSPVESTIVSKTATTSKSITLDSITSNKASKENMNKYLNFRISSNAAFTYKMYIEKIEFYVLTNESSKSQMTFTLKMSNMATENNLANPDTITEVKEHTPKANQVKKYSFKIDKTVATATGTTIEIDISESSELLLNKDNLNSDFKWMIYGFKIYGESREYSK